MSFSNLAPSQTKKASPMRLYIFYSYLSVCMNMVHPVTPTLVKELGFSSFLYSALSSTLALTNFLCAPLWGYYCDRRGRRPVLLIGTALYTCSQVIFSRAKTVPLLLFARMCGGIGSAGYLTGSLAYVVDVSPTEEKGRNLAIFTALTSIFSSFGYLAGGMIGTRFSVMTTFHVQILLLCTCVILGYFILIESRSSEELRIAQADTQAKKFYDFKAMGKIMTVPVMLFLCATIVANFGTMGYDNAFNYYIKDVLAFPSAYNGYIKATTGILGLIANFTLSLWLIRHFRPQDTLLVLFPCCATALFLAPQMKSIPTFLLTCIVFYFFNSVYLPILQTMMTQIKTENTGLLSGMFNAAKSIGSFVGPLFMSFVYSKGTEFPFYAASLAFLVAMLILLLHRKAEKKALQAKQQLPVA
ncbi:MAG: MFS transporter [Clostridia bacterium]|nr:MFS transporter [Clostridia bacterium]